MQPNDPDLFLAKTLASVYRLILSWPDPSLGMEEMLEDESIVTLTDHPPGLAEAQLSSSPGVRFKMMANEGPGGNRGKPEVTTLFGKE
jgi:hypothetical protein